MKKTMFTLIFFLLCIGTVFAQTDWRNKLSKDLVEYKDGKMVWEEYGICKLEMEGYEPISLQVQLHSEAPEGGIISRDNFIEITSSLFTMSLISFLGGDVPLSTFFAGFDYKELASIIGTADLKFNLYMTDEGIQIEVIDTTVDETNRMVQTWAEVYGK